MGLETAENNVSMIEGRNAVREAFRAGKTIDRLFVQDGLKDGPVMDLIRRAKKADALVDYVQKDRLDQMSETGRHQGVIAQIAAYEYAEVEDILKKAPAGRDLGSSQSGRYYPYRQSVRSTRTHHTEAQGCRPDCHCREGQRGCDPLYSGRPREQYGPDDRRTEERRSLVRVRGYGRRGYVRSEPDRTYRRGDRS